MRLTPPSLTKIPLFWWGKGWGHKPGRNKTHFLFREQWKAKSRRKIEDYEQTLPKGVTVEDPNKFVVDAMREELSPIRTAEELKEFPWPFSNRPIKGFAGDPKYNETPALVYHRYRKLLDPINQPLVFTNTVIEGDQELPESVNHLMVGDIDIDDQFIDLLARRLDWCKTSDSTMRKLPINREYPYLDQRPPRVWGIPPNRQELNYLRTLYDSTQLLSSKQFGFVDISKISYPYCVVPFNRDNRLVVFDLDTDFITVANSGNRLPLFSTTPLATIDKPLASINPLNWTTCFDEKNVYPTDYEFKLPDNHNIQTIYFTHNQLLNLNDTYFVGRAINYCYGYATAQARLMAANNDIQHYKDLADPVPVQCVFINPNGFTLGFMCYQLNTTSFDSPLKNQVWFKTGITDLADIQKHLLAFHVNGFVEPITKTMKTFINS
ncbi:uncharacterized protein LOC128952113 [Oppia nitens]|uniref:uncharacterized protein LOC128952113 n=1 Tax=Oppia nitens TaxID=1686743 RepID=UPI0023DCD756|nr:uncharacterized protein LOC128952113 [Oppia nitens]